MLAVCIPAYVYTTISAHEPVIGMQVTQILPSLIRALTAYFIGVGLFRKYGDTPLGSRPLFGLVGFVVVIICLGFVRADIGDLIFVLVAAPLIIRTALGLEERTWGVLLGLLSFALYAVHAPVIQLAITLGWPISVAGLASLATAVVVIFIWELPRSKRTPNIFAASWWTPMAMKS